MPIDDQIAPALASDEALGRPHIARAMVAAGHVATVQEAFDQWIDRNGPAYVPRQGMHSRAAIDAILAAGGIPVLAHYPAAPEQPTLIELLMGWGMRGLEVYYRRFDARDGRAMDGSPASCGLLPRAAVTTMATRMRTPRRMQTTYVPAGGRRRRCWPPSSQRGQPTR